LINVGSYVIIFGFQNAEANPKVLVECLQEMRIEGITRSNVASHLQVKKKTHTLNIVSFMTSIPLN